MERKRDKFGYVNPQEGQAMSRNWKQIKEDENQRQMEIEEGVKKLFTKWVITICRTSTVAILGMALWVGQWIAAHSERVMSALSALFGGRQ